MQIKLFAIFFFFLVSFNATAQSVTGPQSTRAPLNICTADQVTCTWPYKLNFSGASVTNNGDGTATVTVTPSSATNVGVGTTGRHLVYTSTNTAGASVSIFEASGNIGIGSIPVSNKLEVTGTTQIGPAACVATGGTVTTSGGYTIHTFTSNGTLTVTSGCSNAEYLIVAGGGGGGTGIGGGGGAGGLLQGTGTTLTAQAYSIVVGSGGGADASGNNSSFNGLTAIGGGAGGRFNNVACTTGGSGGGAGGASTGTPQGCDGTAGQGNRGGNGNSASGAGSAGGGAGAGANGTNASGLGSPGNGGTGINSSITGTTVMYACGGGGGFNNGTQGCSSAGNGGNGVSQPGGNAVANTGSGGGGGSNSSGAGGTGGSGIVVVRYPTTSYLRVSTSGNVGIGLQSPVNTLDVEGNVAIGELYSGASMAPSNGLIVQGNVGIGTTTPQGGLVVTNGSVGIGTWAPNNVLQVAHGNNSSVGVRVTDLQGNSLGLTASKGSNGLPFIGSFSNNALTLGAVGNEHVRISTEGNVGIGSIAPKATLNVLQTSAADAFRVDDVSGDTTPFVIDSNGNVGIGTTVANAEKLRITGSNDGGNVVGITIKNANSMVGTAVSIDLNTFATDSRGPRIQGIRTNASNFESALAFSTDGAGQTERMRIDTNGNVGIGSTAPQDLLVVQGQFRVTDTNTGGNAGTSACIDASGRLCACGTCE